jgi:hypothetical protein
MVKFFVAQLILWIVPKKADKPPTIVRCPGVVKPSVIINDKMANAVFMVSQILEGILIKELQKLENNMN